MYEIQTFPILGSPLYLIVTYQTTTRITQRDIQKALDKTKPLYTLK